MENILKKPMTTVQFFTLIGQRLEEEGYAKNMLIFLDHVQTTAAFAEMKSPDVEIHNRIRYAGNGSIRMDLSAAFADKHGREAEHPLGYFVTSGNSPEAMHFLASLLADFMICAREYIFTHRDDFCWTGYDVYPIDWPSGERNGIATTYDNWEEAEQRAKTMQEGYPFVAVRDNAARKVKYYVPDSYAINSMDTSYDLEARKCTGNAGNAAGGIHPEGNRHAGREPQREPVMEIHGLKIFHFADGLYYILSPNGKCVKSGLPLAKAEDICNKTIAALACFGLADDDMAITLYMSVFAEGE